MNLDLLAEVRLGVIVAFSIVEGDAVLVGWLDFAQTEETVGSIVTTWLFVLGAAQPPSRTIRCSPTLLVRILRVHGVGGAATTTILWAGNVHDEVRMSNWASGIQEGSPIGSTSRSKELGTTGAAALVQRPSDIVAVGALDERASRVVSFQGDSAALAGLRTPLARLCGDLLNTTARDGDLALRKGW